MYGLSINKIKRVLLTQINLYWIFEGMTENKCNLSVRSHKVDTALNNADTSCTANNISIPWRRASSLYASRDWFLFEALRKRVLQIESKRFSAYLLRGMFIKIPLASTDCPYIFADLYGRRKDWLQTTFLTEVTLDFYKPVWVKVSLGNIYFVVFVFLLLFYLFGQIF